MAVNDIAVQEFVNAIKEPPQDTNNTYNATVSRIDDEGVVWVYLQGSEIETPTASTSSEVEAGDSVTVQWRNNKLYIEGNYSNPSAGTATVTPTVNFVTELLEKDISANSISATTGYIGELTARKITAEDITADHATIDSLDANYAHITDGVIDNAKIGYADVEDLDANYAHISNGVIDNAEIDYADVNNLSANYAQINLANVNNAWIENGVVKDAAISDAQILGVSANKLTAGTIDASNITVTNLNASNITTGSITVDGITIDVENNEASIDGSYIEDGTITMNGFAQEVKDVIDGAIETFTGTVVPTLNNAPANAWTTTKLKDQHIGDVYYVVNASSKQNGYCYRFSKSGSTYSWQLIKDSDVTAALQRLQTAEGKISNIESFDEEMATFKTETEGEISTLQTKTTSLETSLGDKVDKTVFNEVKQTVDGNSSTITTLTETTQTLRNDLDGLEIGGRNYFVCYDNPLADNKFINHVTYDYNASNGEYTLTVTETGNFFCQIVARVGVSNLSDILGKTVTLSAQSITSSNANANPKVYFYGTKEGGTWSKGIDSENLTNTFEVPTDLVKAGYIIRCDQNTADVVGDVATFTGIKLEKGNKATDWTPAPEDMATAESVTTVSNTVNEVSQTATANRSKISNLTTTLGTNADGTTKAGDIVHQVSQIDQDLDGVTTRVSKTEVKLAGQYATSSTAAGTAAKVATIVPTLSGYELAKGAMVTVKFTTANTAASPTLNLNSTGAKAIKTYSGGNLTADEYKWKAGSTFTFTYNGTNWLMQDSTASVRMNSAESKITQTATSIESVVANNDTYTAPDGTTKTNAIKSAIKQNADNIELKVSKDGVIASINASVEKQGGSAVKIRADKVNIEGAAIFTGSGRLSETSLDNAYDAKGAASAAESNAKDYADGAVADKAGKSNAVARTQRIYYRKTSSGAPSANKTWLATSGTGYGNWSLKVPQMTSGTTKYPYLYTAVQTQTVAQMAAGNACSCSAVLLDDTTTVIDGGHITTGTIDTNRLNADTIKSNIVQTTDLNASKITAGDIAADRMKVNSIEAINSLTTGKIDADRLNVGQITVGDLSDGSSYSTTAQMNTAIGNAVDDVTVGGRNLILNTVRQRTGTSASNSVYVSPNPTLSEYGQSILTNTTDEFTYSFDYEITGNSSTTSQIYFQAKGSVASGSTLKTSGNASGHYSHTFKLNATQAASTTTTMRIRMQNATDGAIITVKNIKLEKGNKETDWSSAPEDYITDIDGTGVRVHPANSEDNSVVINAKGMEVFKGGTTDDYSVAFYGDTARIGKESGSHLTLASDSMSMSDGNKNVFNLIQKTMYICWTHNYKGRQFTNSTDRHIDSWDTGTTISTWSSITVNYKLNNTSRTKKITSISNGVLANDEIYVHFNYSGTIITLTYGRGSSAASSDIIKLESAVVYYVTDEKLSQLHTGTYPNTTVSGPLRIGNGTSDSDRKNVLLVDWSGSGKFRGDVLAFCNSDSSGGMSLTKAEENIDAFKYEDANGHVYINAYRVGRIVSLLCGVTKTASTAAGANLYQLPLTNAHFPKPLGTNTSGTGMAGKNMIFGNIYYNKTVTPNRYEFVCRNGGSTAVSTGTTGFGFTITYICQMDEVSGEIKYMDD